MQDGVLTIFGPGAPCSHNLTSPPAYPAHLTSLPSRVEMLSKGLNGTELCSSRARCAR